MEKQTGNLLPWERERVDLKPFQELECLKTWNRMIFHKKKPRKFWHHVNFDVKYWVLLDIYI